MATTEVPLYSVARQDTALPSNRAGALACAALTILAIGIHGYHPYAEDGGVYLAGIKRLLHPQLYPYFSDFVTTHLKFSLFAPMMAAIVRLLPVGLMSAMFVVYVGSTWLTLYSGWLLVRRVTSSTSAQFGAVALLALALTIPVAGTSLMLMDPYVTARSISTPCGILMLVAVLDLQAGWAQERGGKWKSVGLLAASLMVAAAMHPLMAAYSGGCMLLLICVSVSNRSARIAASGAACLVAVALAGCVDGLGPATTAEYALVARTRTYWFPASWRWYELLGLAGPLVVLAILWLRRSAAVSIAGKRLALMSILAGSTATAVAAIFARVSSRSYEVAKLQPLRIYQTIYLLMLLALGALLAERVLKRSIARWSALFLLVGGLMGFVQWQTFPDSGHVEFPWRAPANGWEQGFDWIRTHTPKDAVFGLDADYISAGDEDSQNFRAIAERSAMPDYAKDGGIAAIAPGLTAQWLVGEPAQKQLDRGVGAAEIARLRSYGVNWVVVTHRTHTSFSCGFENASVKVCALP